MIASVHSRPILHISPLTLRLKRAAERCVQQKSDDVDMRGLLRVLLLVRRELQSSASTIISLPSGMNSHPPEMFVQARCQVRRSLAHGCGGSCGDNEGKGGDVTPAIVMSTCEIHGRV